MPRPALAFIVSALWAGSADAQEPSPTLLHRPAPELRVGEPAVIEGVMEGASDVESAELFYSSGAIEGWKVIELRIVDAETYAGTIPATDLGPPALQYYVVATDFLGNRKPALGSANRPIVVRVIAPAPRSTKIATTVPERESPTKPGRGNGGKTEDKPRSTAPRAHIGRSLDRATIRASGARTLVDLLRLFPELSVTRSFDGRYHVTLQGLSSDGDVLVYFDGIPVTDPLTGASELAWPASTLESVALRFDTRRSFAGIIELVSVRSAGARMGAGSSASTADSDLAGDYFASGAVQVGGPTQRAVLGASAYRADGVSSQLRRDGYSERRAESLTPATIADEPTDFLAHGALDLQLLEGARLAVFARQHERKPFAGRVDSFSDIGRDRQRQAGLSLATSYGDGRATGEFGAGVALTERLRHDRLAPPGVIVSGGEGEQVFVDGIVERHRARAVASHFDASWGYNTTQSLHVWTEGGWTFHHAGAPSVRRNIRPDGVQLLRPTSVDAGEATSRTVLRLGTGLDYNSDSVRFHAGVYGRWLSDLSFALDRSLTPDLSLTWLATQAWSLELRGGAIFRAPTLGQNYDRSATGLPWPLTDGRTRGTPALNVSGARFVSSALRYNRDALSMLVEAFYRRELGNVIAVPVVSGLWDFRYGRPVNRIGARGEVERRFAGGSTVRAAVAWQRGETQALDSGRDFVLSAVPQLVAIAQVRIDLDALGGLFVAFRGESRRSNDRWTGLERERTFQIQSQATVDAAWHSPAFAESFEVTLAVFNGLDGEWNDAPTRPDTSPLVARERLRAMAFLSYMPEAGP